MKIKGFFGILLLSTASTYAGTLTLVGGDAWSLHGNTTFGQQIVNYMGGNVAFINDSGWGADGTVVSVQGVNVTVYATLPDLATMLGFTGIYFDSPGDCCSDPGNDPSLFSPSYASDLNAYMAAGGNLAVQDWEANPVWTPVFGFDASPGFLGATCGFNGAATPAGYNAGFTGDGTGGAGSGLYSDGCLTHQSYDGAFLAANDFATLITDTGLGSPLVVSAAPEPATYALVGLALSVVGLRRRAAARKQQ
jgi:hypothetical protein